MADPSPSAFLSLRRVSKSYLEGGRRHDVLRDAELSVAAGEFVVILGKSGSGKSTLLNLVSGIDLPDAGEVMVGGVSLSGLGERGRTLFRRRRVGFVFQSYNLIPTLTVSENVRLKLELGRVERSLARERARRLLERVGLGDRESAFPDVLSGGEQQRVAIAAALAHDPELVLADEPTGNLDEETGRNVVALLDEMVRSAGRTLLMVTHSREMVGVADRVVAVEGGRLVEHAAESRS